MSETNIGNEKKEQLLETVKTFIIDNGGIVKKSQFSELAIDYRVVLDLVDKGEIIRLKSGYYTVKDNGFSEEELLVKLFPDGVLTLESALYAYGYIKNRPLEWRIAVDKNTSKSRFKSEGPKVLPMYTEPEMFEDGVTTIAFGNGNMKIYGKDRLICECLKYEDKMDRSIFQEGLRSYIEDSEKDFTKLLSFAAVRKVSKKVQSMIGVWLVSKDEKHEALEEHLAEILHYLELIPSMEAYEKAYELLGRESYDGRRFGMSLLREWDKLGQELSTKQSDFLREYESSSYMEKRWKQHVKNRKTDIQHKCDEFPEWQEVCGRVNRFVLPIWECFCRDEIFFGDWMPDLERYLQ